MHFSTLEHTPIGDITACMNAAFADYEISIWSVLSPYQQDTLYTHKHILVGDNTNQRGLAQCQQVSGRLIYLRS